MEKPLRFLVGTYNQGSGNGLFLFDYKAESNTAEYVAGDPISNASFVIPGPEGVYFAVSEMEEGPSYVHSFRIENGDIRRISSFFTSQNGICHLCLTPDNRHLVTADYGSGTLGVFLLDRDSRIVEQVQTLHFQGTGPDKERQDKPHPHYCALSPEGRYIFVCDLGTDSVYRFDITSREEELLDEEKMSVTKVKPGSGPRKLIFSPDGRFAYTINELSGTVDIFSYDNGDLRYMRDVVVDEGNSRKTADLVMSSDGELMFASVREKNDGIAVFVRDSETGLMTLKGYYNCYGRPRKIAYLDSARRLFVGGIDRNAVQTFHVGNDGALMDEGTLLEIKQPGWVGFPNLHGIG